MGVTSRATALSLFEGHGGLLAEEYNVPGRHLAENFPQALTHLAVVNAAPALSGPTLRRGGKASTV